RTPLHGVVAMADLLLETPLEPRQREYAETIRASGQTLVAIVNDILDLALKFTQASSAPHRVAAADPELQAHPQDADAHADSRANAAASAGPVLVVDDQEVNRLVAELMLTHLGYRCLSVEGGAAALAV